MTVQYNMALALRTVMGLCSCLVEPASGARTVKFYLATAFVVIVQATMVSCCIKPHNEDQPKPPPPPPPPPYHALCSEGWTPYTYDLKCYKYFTLDSTHEIASTYCKQNNGQLVSVTDRRQNRFLAELVGANNYARINVKLAEGSDGGPQGMWIDLGTGERIKYSYWAKYQPQRTEASTKKCVGIYGDQPHDWNYGTWRANDCNARYKFICQRYEGVYCRREFDFHDDGNCYEARAGARATFTAARTYCNQDGAGLATAHTLELNMFLKKVVIAANIKDLVWLSARADPSDHTRWRWEDKHGHPFMLNANYWHWANGEPDGKSGKAMCMTMHPGGGEWYDDSCELHHYFVCVMPRTGLAEASVANEKAIENIVINPDGSPGLRPWISVLCASVAVWLPTPTKSSPQRTPR